MSGLIWTQTVALMVFLEEFFEKVDFVKIQTGDKKSEKFPGGGGGGQRVKCQ